MSQLKLVDLFPRNVLVEGRNYGIGWAFAKRKDDTLTCVGPISCCREYLNDVVYTENTKKSTSAYGYTTKYEGLLEDPFLYIVIGILRHFGGGTYQGIVKHTEYLKKKHKLLEGFINQVEDKLKLTEKTTILPLDQDNRYVMEIPKFWGSATYLISLHTMMIRVALEESYETGDAIEFFQHSQGYDAFRVGKATTRLKEIIDGRHRVQDFGNIIAPGCDGASYMHYTIHQAGICDTQLS